MVDLARSFLRRLLASVDPAEASLLSYDNYHVKGFSYINLLRTRRLTAKLYVVLPGEVALNAEGWLVNPHNHGYCFDTYVAVGGMHNVTFVEREDGEAWEELSFASALRGTPAVSRVGGVRLKAVTAPALRAGQSYSMDDKEIHTIWVPPNRLTILFLLQYETTAKGATRLFTRNGAEPDLRGLYTPMGEARVASLVALAEKEIAKC